MHNPSSRRVAVVGAGHAGANVAALLRQRGHTGEIVLLGAEKELPYQRPPLSKDYLKTALPATELLIKPEEFWNEQGIDARLGVVVEEIRPDDDEVVLEGVSASGTTPSSWPPAPSPGSWMSPVRPSAASIRCGPGGMPMPWEPHSPPVADSWW